MTITLFRSTKEPDVFGFTVDPTGSNLPAQLGPWQSAGAGTVATSYAETNLDGLALSDPVMRAIKQNGFYLTRSGVTNTVTLDKVASTDDRRIKDAMILHIFQSAKMPELYGFTVDATGANLPVKDGPWEVAGNTIPLGTTMASTSPGIAHQIERNGYALVKGHSVSQPHLRRNDSRP